MRWVKLPALLALAVLVYSELVTDRVAATQILWWAPRVFLTLPALAWLLLSLGVVWFLGRNGESARVAARAERRRLVWWIALSMALALALGLRDWRPARAPVEGALRVVHWNAACLALEDSAGALERLLAVDADVVIVTDQCWMLSKGGAEQVRARGFEILGAGKFTAFSRYPARESRPLFASRGRSLGRFVLETPHGAITIDAIDLPSATTLPRLKLMQTFVAELAAVERREPDVYIGDFNITRGSASLSVLAPGHRDAFLAAGSGWAGSYPRGDPFWGIDLALVRAPWQAVRYEVIDLGIGRHRAQRVDLVRDGEEHAGRSMAR